MYCVMRFCPASPSFCNASNCGRTTVINCMMIDAVMYGMMPSAKNERFCSAWPENMFR